MMSSRLETGGSSENTHVDAIAEGTHNNIGNLVGNVIDGIGGVASIAGFAAGRSIHAGMNVTRKIGRGLMGNSYHQS